ncbi:MAG TPA: hypothetical protein DD381_12835 [Lentisphaeria bacterium]|nr:MAG: hypothetical protein A2X47_12405 [Lentisphaerae bacterium GWF2_38_69]HBM17210.1 hypothetical protein [Lentisphaeria bacterium]
MKKNLITILTGAVLLTSSVSVIAIAGQGANYDILFARAQNIIEKLPDISGLKTLSENEKGYFADMYVIALKSGEIVYTPQNTTNKQVISAEDAVVIADKVVKAWQADESKVVYDLGNYLVSVVVTNSRDVYILVIPDTYKSGI